MVILQNCASGGTSDIKDLLSFVNNEGVIDISAKDIKGMTLVPDHAFYQCESLHSIELPNTVITIGESAFYGCYSLESITLDVSITSIGSAALYNCINLISINYNGTIAQWNNIYKGTDWDLYADSYTIHCTDGDIVKERLSYTLNSDGLSYSVSSIGNVQSSQIVIPQLYKMLPVTKIGDNAFYGNRSISTISIPNTITEIGEFAFHACESITSIDITDSITNIKRSAFGACNNLTSISFGSGLTNIGANAFQNCGILNLSIPDNVVEIGDYAFGWCNNLSTVIIPDSVNIADHTFYGCSSIAHITGNSNHVLSVVNQSGASSYGATITSSVGDNEFQYKSHLTNVTLSDSVTSIGSNSFAYSGVTSFIIGNGVTNIGNGAFWYCPLTSIIIPDNVINLGNYAFGSCTDLASITLGSGITNIGERLFVDCSNLVSITYNGTVAQWLSLAKGSQWNSGTGNYTIYCTNGEIAKDGTITYYPTEGLAYTLNQDGQSYSCSGIGTATDTDIIIASTYDGLAVTEIGASAFYNNRQLTSIVVQDSVTKIGAAAFYNCSSIKSITLPTNLSTISSYMCQNCTDLSLINIPNNITSIESMAFSGCSNLTSITVPNTVSAITYASFSGCSNLASISLPSNLSAIYNAAFNNCINLTSINYDNTMNNWQNLTKDTGWDNNTGNYVVHCTDGDIPKQQ